MNIIKVFDLTGEYALKEEDGTAIYDAVIEDIKKSKRVVLDFAGVKLTTSSFFNYGICRLVGDISLEKLHQYLKIQNLVYTSLEVLNACFTNAVKHYQSEIDNEKLSDADKQENLQANNIEYYPDKSIKFYDVR